MALPCTCGDYSQASFALSDPAAFTSVSSLHFRRFLGLSCESSGAWLLFPARVGALGRVGDVLAGGEWLCFREVVWRGLWIESLPRACVANHK